MNELTQIDFPWWAWTGFAVFILAMLSIDLGLFNRKAHEPSYKETVGWSIAWVSLAFIFNILIYFYAVNYFSQGNQAPTLLVAVSNFFSTAQPFVSARDIAVMFFTGYLIELSLSVDNLFVFLLIFSYFKVPKPYQHRVLFWGVLGALIMRIIMIFIGATLIEQFHWIIYIFGAFLIYTGIKMFKEEEAEIDPEKNPVVNFVTRFIPITRHYDGDKFFTIENGKKVGTLLFLVLIIVEVTDLVFAVDSIPAIFGITTDRFIVYTSNVFAIMGLRTFFFLLVSVIEKFHYLRVGLAFVLTFIGVKMVLPLVGDGAALALNQMGYSAAAETVKHYDHIPTTVSLVVVVVALALSIVLSLVFPKDKRERVGDIETEIE